MSPHLDQPISFDSPRARRGEKLLRVARMNRPFIGLCERADQTSRYKGHIHMKTVIRLVAVAVLAMAFISSTLAGDCCTKAAAAAKSCEKCTKGDACKEAAKNVTANGEAKSCEKCAPKK